MSVKAILLILTSLYGCQSRMAHTQPSCRTANIFDSINCVDSKRHSIQITFKEETLYIRHKNGLVDIDLETFPKLNISKTLRQADRELRRIKMENCTLPDGQSFGILFEHLGVDYEILAFEGINIAQSWLPLDGHFSSGFEKIENLTLSKNVIRKLREHVFQSLTKLSNLDLRKNAIENVHKNAFKNLTELGTLKLSNNNLKSLNAGMFDSQKRLTDLYLHSNKLENLSKEMFQGLDSLIVLTLHDNEFSDLTNDVFHNLPALKQINFGNYVGVANMPYTIFEKQSHLEFVFLQQVQVDEGLQLSGLEMLDITSSKVGTISGLSNISMVSITECLNPLVVSSFKNLTSTKRLNLSSNAIISLPDGLFDGLKELDQLQLSHNDLTSISRLDFQDLQSLSVIDLSYNDITTIHPKAFANNKQLTIINLKENQILFSDSNVRQFMHLYNLRILNLSGNNLTRIPSDLVEMKNGKLEELDLSFNNISMVTFSEIRQNSINLSSTNEIFRVNETRIYLNDNPLNCDCSMFEFLSGTHQRHLAPIFDFKCHKDSVFMKTCTRKTYADDKCPTKCNCTGDEFAVHVSCKGKQLTSPPDIKFINAKSIELDISDNSLTELPILQTDERVTFIQASLNQISEIKTENLPPNLRGLDLSHNDIRIIAPNVIHSVQKHQKLEVFLVKDNPFTCHCTDTKPLIEFAKENSSITDLKGAKCDLHYELSDEMLQKTCRREAMIYILASVTILISMSGVTLVLFFKNRKFIKMWLYSHDWFLWWVDEEYIDRDKEYDIFISYADENRLTAYRIFYALKKCNVFKICWHEQDFIAGESIDKSIYNAVHKSRRTLVILSEDYGKSPWCLREFDLAWNRCVDERRKLIIAVKDGDLSNIEDETIQSYIKTHTYIEAGSQWFWERLIFRLPLKKMIKNIFPIREYETGNEKELENEVDVKL